MSDERPERPTALEVRPDSIPETLKNRDQWVFWRYEWREDDEQWTKPPKNVNTGSFASSTDSDTWVSFDEALDYHERDDTDTDGIGFVVNDDDTISGLDLDDCRDPETGEFESWARDIISDVPTYAEVSPSDTGARLIGLGFIPEGGNRDDLEGLEGHLEMYDKGRYLTLTGHHIDGSPEDVEQVNEEIAEVHAEYIADDDEDQQTLDDPDVSSESVSDVDDNDLIERAKKAKNGDKFADLWRGSTAGYPSHSEARQALANLLAFWTGGDEKRMLKLFRQSNLCRGDDDLRTFENYEIPTALDGRTEFYEPGAGNTPPETDGSEVVETDDGEEKDLPVPSTLSVKDGCYGIWRHREDGENEWDQKTNFQIEANSYATDPDDPSQKQIDMTIHPAVGEPYDVVAPPTVFNEKREFKANVVTGLTTTFSGGEDVLNRLKTFVGTQEDVPTRTGTYQMGRFGDEWVTPEGVLTADGWSDDPEHIHVSRDIGAERKWELTPEDGDEYDPAEVASILELLPETRDPNRFIPVLGWFYSTPFKPLIQEWTGQFNLLGVLGETGAGKSATLSVLWELFGMGGDPMTADDTKYVLLTTLASTNSIPMWFDEYKPSDMSDWAVDTFWNEIRKTTRGGVSARGNPDGSTTEYHLNAPAVVSGEERVHGSAEERRGIYTTFKKTPTEAGSDHSRAFAELTGGAAKTNGDREYFDGYDRSQHALALYQWALGLDTEKLQEDWRDCARHVSELLDAHDIDALEELVEQGLQTIKFGATVYRGFASEMGLDPDEVLPKDAIDEAILYAATNAIGGANRKSHLDVLFEVAARAASHGYLEEGVHYKFVHEGEADEEFRLNLTTGFDQIVRYANDHSVAEDLLNSKDDYKERIGDELENDDGYVATKSKPTGNINRAVGIYRRKAEAQIEGFEKGMFTDEAVDELTDVSEPKPVPVSQADTSVRFQTFTVECIATDDPNSDKIRQAGMVRDATDKVEFINWEHTGPLTLEEGECYRIVDAKVGTNPEGATQLELDPRVTAVDTIQEGAGYLSLANSEGNERLSAATDGGDNGESKIISPKPVMKTILNEEGPLSKAEWIAKTADREDAIDPSTAEHGITELKKQGDVQKTDDGEKWEVV